MHTTRLLRFTLIGALDSEVNSRKIIAVYKFKFLMDYEIMYAIVDISKFVLFYLILYALHKYDYFHQI